MHHARPSGDHRDPDAGVDDHQPVADARRGLRHRQRRVRRLQRPHALGRERHRAGPGERGRDDGPHRRARRRRVRLRQLGHEGARHRVEHGAEHRRHGDQQHDERRVARRAGVQRLGHHLHHPYGLHRPPDRPVPAPGEDPRVQPGRPGHPPAQPQLGRVAVPPRGGLHRRVDGVPDPSSRPAKPARSAAATWCASCPAPRATPARPPTRFASSPSPDGDRRGRKPLRITPQRCLSSPTGRGRETKFGSRCPGARWVEARTNARWSVRRRR